MSQLMHPTKRIAVIKKTLDHDESLNEEQGAVLVETGIALWFILLLLVGIIDISFLLVNFICFEQAAREGVRTAGRIAIISTDCGGSTCEDMDADSYKNGCATGTVDEDECAHVFVHTRVRTVLGQHNLMSVIVPNVNIASVYDDSGGTNLDSVSVVLNGTFNGFFLNYPLTVSSQGPYLF